MSDEDDIKLIEAMEMCKMVLEGLKKRPDKYDGRAISIAATHLETAQLWFANSRKEV